VLVGFNTSFPAWGEVALGEIFNRGSILEFSPRANPLIVDALVTQFDGLKSNGIDSELRIRHFLVQMATETGGFRRLDENLDYSAEQLRKVFKSRVSPERAAALAHKPIEIANFVYSRRLGNGDPSSNDGWTYRGSWYLQLTGRTNFRDRGGEIGMDLEAQPDQARQPSPGLRAAVAYWMARNINSASDQDDLVRVRRLVNGGSNGLDHARIWYARAKRIFVTPSTRPSDLGELAKEELAGVAEALTNLGYLPPTGAPASLDSFDDALKLFQQDQGLPASGYLDEATLYAITDPLNRFGKWKII
jgi:putative chitinase